MTFENFLTSVENDSQPPSSLSTELKALWLTKANRWEEAHDLAQDINTQTGSWIHALLHLIEGDTWNAEYWFTKAGKPTKSTNEIDSEWLAIMKSLLDS